MHSETRAKSKSGRNLALLIALKEAHRVSEAPTVKAAREPNEKLTRAKNHFREQFLACPSFAN